VKERPAPDYSPWPAIWAAAAWVALLLALDPLSGALYALRFTPNVALGRATVIASFGQAAGLFAAAALLVLGSSRQRRSTRQLAAISALSLTTGLVLALLAVVFALDGARLVATLPPEEHGRFILLTVKGEWQLVTGSLMLGATGFVARAWWRELRDGDAAPTTDA
jgi:hypothetical protein